MLEEIDLGFYEPALKIGFAIISGVGIWLILFSAAFLQ